MLGVVVIASFVLCLAQTLLADDINIIPTDSLLWWSQDASQQPLDAEFLNVYQGAHGVVMLFDVTKQWYVYAHHGHLASLTLLVAYIIHLVL